MSPSIPYKYTWILFFEEKEISMQSWKETIFFPVFSSPLSASISSFFSPPPATPPPPATVKDLPCNTGNDTSLSSLPSKQVCSSFCHLETCHNHLYAEILQANDTFFWAGPVSILTQKFGLNPLLRLKLKQQSSFLSNTRSWEE